MKHVARSLFLVSVAVLFATVRFGDARASGVPAANCPLQFGRANSAPAPESFPWTDSKLDENERLELLFAQLTLAEKIDLATGEACGLYGFFNAPIPRLKIPALAMADGPSGVRVANLEVNGGLSTAMPAPIALAASWDRALATAYGDLLGQESFMTGHNVQLGPAIDIVRGPLGGRGFETFGEDPLLQSEISVPYVEAIQTHHVLADAKHAAIYNQETNRLNGIDVMLDERAIHEIYMPPFQAVIERANIGTAMCAFNKVNGVFQCEDGSIQNDILKDEFGLQGFVMSDYGATQSTVASALGGLDQEQPSEVFFGQHLLEAVANDSVPMEVLDDKARRVLRPMFQHGLFDHPVEITPIPAQEHGAVAREIEKHSIVLLKNSESTLPLARSGLTSVAVIGPDANDITAQGGGSSQVDATYGVSPLQGVQKAVGSAVKVTYTPGTDPITAGHVLPGGERAVPSSVLTPPAGSGAAQGLLATYWMSTDFSGEPVTTRVERQVGTVLGFMNFGLTPTVVEQLPETLTASQFSARWTGTLTVPATGEYTLTLTTRGRGTLFLDDSPIIMDQQSHDTAPSSAPVQLTEGSTHSLRIDYVADFEGIGSGGGTEGGQVLLSWTPPEGAIDPGIAAAAAAAKAADVAIVFVRDFETEGHDRPSLTLPNFGDTLIAQVVAANPRTIVVLQTGLPVQMPWLESVPAVLEAWYGGQEQGNAIAAVLFGDVNPSGKLPVTFPRSADQTPTAQPAQFPGVNGIVSYSEGIFVGYRWYDHFDVDPLFAFGYGLSYTTFTYGELKVASSGSLANLQSPLEVKFKVSNTGSRAGAEVAQVYVGTLPTAVPTPPRQLAGFAKVQLAPGESQTVTVQIDPRSLSYWDTTTRAWVTPAGGVPIYVGSSSRDIRLTGSAQVGVQ